MEELTSLHDLLSELPEKSHGIMSRFISFPMLCFFKQLTQPEAALSSVRHRGFGFSCNWLLPSTRHTPVPSVVQKTS